MCFQVIHLHMRCGYKADFFEVELIAELIFVFQGESTYLPRAASPLANISFNIGGVISMRFI